MNKLKLVQLTKGILLGGSLNIWQLTPRTDTAANNPVQELHFDGGMIRVVTTKGRTFHVPMHLVDFIEFEDNGIRLDGSNTKK